MKVEYVNEFRNKWKRPKQTRNKNKKYKIIWIAFYLARTYLRTFIFFLFFHDGFILILAPHFESNLNILFTVTDGFTRIISNHSIFRFTVYVLFNSFQRIVTKAQYTMMLWNCFSFFSSFLKSEQHFNKIYFAETVRLHVILWTLRISLFLFFVFVWFYFFLLVECEKSYIFFFIQNILRKFAHFQ